MIKKEIRMGTITKHFRVEDGVAIMTTNNPRVTFQVFQASSKAGKPNITYNHRLGAFIEKFPGKNENEIWELLEKDLKTANKEGRKARAYALKQKK